MNTLSMHMRTLAAGVLLAAAVTAQATVTPVTYGSNLIVNGDAEAGVSGWQAYSSYGLIQSVNYGSNWVLPTQPGPDDRGSRMFTGVGEYSVGYQVLDLGLSTTQPLAYALSGWLGGWQAQGDNAMLYVSFLDAFDIEIGGAAIGPVMPADRNNVTGLFYREDEGWLPSGTSRLSFWLSMERHGGGDNDGYADNLSFMLFAPAVNPVSEPPALALLMLAVLGLARHQRARSSAALASSAG